MPLESARPFPFLEISMSKMKDIVTEAEEAARLKYRADTWRSRLVAVCFALAMVFGIMVGSSECKAGGFYFYTGLGDLNSTQDWDSNGGTPAMLEAGYKSDPLRGIWGQPKFLVRGIHLSNFEYSFSKEFNGDDESAMDLYNLGLCWGNC